MLKKKYSLVQILVIIIIAFVGGIIAKSINSEKSEEIERICWYVDFMDELPECQLEEPIVHEDVEKYMTELDLRDEEYPHCFILEYVSMFAKCEGS